MIQVGNRIIFDQDGNLVALLGEMQGDVIPRKEITKLDYIDLKYGEIDYMKYRIIGVNVETKQPILEEMQIYKTDEQQRIEELENQLLLKENENVGGIL